MIIWVLFKKGKYVRSSEQYNATVIPGSRQPVAAVQPITGGIAPTTAPTHVLVMLSLLSGV